MLVNWADIDWFELLPFIPKPRKKKFFNFILQLIKPGQTLSRLFC